LLEFGKAADAIEPLHKAVDQSGGDAPLIRILLAHAELETNDPALLDDAKQNLLAALSKERDNASAWRFRAITESRLNNTGEASLAQ